MKAPRRPRQTRLLPRFCVSGVGLLAAAWIFYFSDVTGVFITKGDVGVGTIVGSAVFNVLVIIGICGIFAGQPISLSWWPLFRDAVFYILSIVVLILVIYDEKVMWWETIILISMYGIYIIIMKFNRSLYSLVERHCSRAGQPCLSSLRRTTAVGSIGDCDNDMVPLKPDSCVVAGQDSGVVMVDEMMNLHPHQLSFSEASLRLLITPHFPPFTRLRMAGRMVISERQRLIRARVGPEEAGASGEEGLGANGAWGRENGTVAEGDTQPLDGERESGKEMGVETGGGAQPKEEEEEEEEQEEGEEEDAPFKPFVLPDRWCVCLKWLFSWPVSVVLYCTIPDCSQPRYTLGIPEVIMGITFLAAGTSVPDCMASLIVARQGMGDMAVSNSIGSNIFDVLLGLGFPWALRTLIVSYGSVVTINSKGLVYSVILLLASVTLTVSRSSLYILSFFPSSPESPSLFTTSRFHSDRVRQELRLSLSFPPQVLCVHLNCWRLDRRLGLCLILLYAIFLLCSIGFERL
ncbi:Sodium/potassium/calcium exchanger 3 [Nibea albiflora]|uniref:Sodium/potassium/calcium exchanger 3 n=1 Tax=Nibea albiflora TaxID=240163 RepID=A0ACB7EQA6_NIBAL|nr:Sodium/potassium/calcium exchanger 3 [Nibea albiflora]